MASYYEILGLSKSASISDVKKAYRDLVLKYHPDKQGGDADTFRKVHEAYDAIRQGKGNSQTNSESDSEVNEGLLKSMLDVLLQFARDLMDKKKRNIYVTMPVTIEEIYNKKVKKITIKVKRRMPDNGIALVSEDFIINLDDYEEAYVFDGRGDDCILKKIPSGDVIIKLEIEKHAFLRIDNLFCKYDLYTEIEIPLLSHYTDTEVVVPFLDNTTIKVPYDKNSRHIKVPQNGLPYNDIRGDLYINVSLKLPDDLDELISEIKKLKTT